MCSPLRVIYPSPLSAPQLSNYCYPAYPTQLILERFRLTEADIVLSVLESAPNPRTISYSLHNPGRLKAITSEVYFGHSAAKEWY